MRSVQQSRHHSRMHTRLYVSTRTYTHIHARVGVVILLILRNRRACIREKDWRCRARVTTARSPWRAHVAYIPRLRQHQSFSRMLLSQKSKTSRISSPKYDTAGYLCFGPIDKNIMFLGPQRAREGLAQPRAWSEGDVSAEHCSARQASKPE